MNEIVWPYMYTIQVHNNLASVPTVCTRFIEVTHVVHCIQVGDLAT
jgi:hypothetical protein